MISFASPLAGRLVSVDPSPSKDVAVTTPIIEDPPDTTLIPPAATLNVLDNVVIPATSNPPPLISKPPAVMVTSLAKVFVDPWNVEIPPTSIPPAAISIPPVVTLIPSLAVMTPTESILVTSS